jgi:hypothetical protein
MATELATVIKAAAHAARADPVLTAHLIDERDMLLGYGTGAVVATRAYDILARRSRVDCSARTGVCRSTPRAARNRRTAARQDELRDTNADLERRSGTEASRADRRRRISPRRRARVRNRSHRSDPP